MLVALAKYVLKRHLKNPVRPILRHNSIVETLQLEVHVLAAYGEDLPETAANGDRPLIAVGRLPVGRYGRVTDEVPAGGEVIPPVWILV